MFRGQALLHARGELRTNERFIGRSIIGSRFDCRIEADAAIGSRPGIVPSISGRAWITGASQLLLDPSDPWPNGYRLSDTWPRLARCATSEDRGGIGRCGAYDLSDGPRLPDNPGHLDPGQRSI